MPELQFDSYTQTVTVDGQAYELTGYGAVVGTHSTMIAKVGEESIASAAYDVPGLTPKMMSRLGFYTALNHVLYSVQLAPANFERLLVEQVY